jgi:hypothetical protein
MNRLPILRLPATQAKVRALLREPGCDVVFRHQGA